MAHSKSFFPCQKTLSIEQIPWSTAKVCHWASGGLGSTGVFLVGFNDGIVVVKQGTTNTPGEIFCSVLAPKLGIRCPKMRVLGDSEFLQAKKGIFGCTFSNPPDSDRLKSRQRVRFMTVMEYVGGTTLPGTPPDIWSSHEVLEQLGRLVFLDVIVGNFDRVPLCWDNSGNFENVMIEPVSEGRHAVVGIDQFVVLNTTKDGLARYFKNIELAFEEIVAENITGPRMSKVKKQLAEVTGLEIDGAACKAFQKGLLDAFRETSSLLSKTPSFFEDVVKETIDLLQSSLTLDNYDPGLEALDASYMKKNFEHVADALGSSKKI